MSDRDTASLFMQGRFFCEMTYSTILRTAAFGGAAAVAIGAFGAHGLKPRLTEYQMAIFEKGVQYQFYHTLALLALGLWCSRFNSEAVSARLRWVALLWTAGIVAFSGSLYLLATRDLLPFSVAWAGPVTPVWGLCFLAGWILLAFEKQAFSRVAS